MLRRSIMILIFILSVTVLSGCSPEAFQTPIDPANSWWDRYFVWPLSVSLDWFAGFFWGEYGLSILVVTIIIRIIILPLMIKQYKSSKQMQAIQPEMKKIREKFKDNQQKIQEETMKLFQKHGINPLAGCFPLLVQMPVLIALYSAISRNEVLNTHTFLWMQLGEKDPYYILPLLAAVTTYIQQKIMMVSMPNQNMQQMKALMVIFPVLIFVMSLSFASALPLYWVYSNIFTIIQSYFLYGRPADQKLEGATK